MVWNMSFISVINPEGYTNPFPRNPLYFNYTARKSSHKTCEAGVARTLTNNTNRKQYHELQEARNRCLQRGYSVLCRRLPCEKCEHYQLPLIQSLLHVWSSELKWVNPTRQAGIPRLPLSTPDKYGLHHPTNVAVSSKPDNGPTEREPVAKVTVGYLGSWSTWNRA